MQIQASKRPLIILGVLCMNQVDAMQNNLFSEINNKAILRKEFIKEIIRHYLTAILASTTSISNSSILLGGILAALVRME